MNLPLYQVDAFTHIPLRGNPAAVCPLTAWLPAATMQQIAAENNLSETAFFVPEGPHYGLRWFTPTTEIDLCGHATLATAHVIFNCLQWETAVVNFVSPRSGALRVAKQGAVLTLDFPRFGLNDVALAPALAAALGAAPRQAWATQGNMLMLLFETEAEIVALRPDMVLLSALPYDEVIVTAPGTDADFVSRLFAPRIGIPEDPVTGATHCSLIPYWATRLGKNQLHARQLSARGGELFCALEDTRVKIGGHAVLYLKGEIYL